MKIFSILLKIPSKVYLVTTVANTFELALANAKAMAIKEHGDLGWEFTLVSSIEINIDNIKKDIMKEMIPRQEVVKQPELDLNWLMKTIIDGKDMDLFEVSKKYMSEPQILYITEKVK